MKLHENGGVYTSKANECILDGDWEESKELTKAVALYLEARFNTIDLKVDVFKGVLYMVRQGLPAQ